MSVPFSRPAAKDLSPDQLKQRYEGVREDVRGFFIKNPNGTYKMSRADFEVVMQQYGKVIQRKNLSLLSPLKLMEFMVTADTNVFRFITADREKGLERVFTTLKNFAIEGGPTATAPGGDVNYFLQGMILASVGIHPGSSNQAISEVIIAWNVKQAIEKGSMSDINQIGRVIPWAQQGFDYYYDNVRGTK
ncbi:hypothetical protein [Opitutus sp. ER46]|uniref:hypothetical protein n=1 Tax=Opitutus sp. ER46 TaxID=2161864 RepID=UPI0011B27EFF|nr:hypothetical protein [Opitutus sp. ER46]